MIPLGKVNTKINGTELTITSTPQVSFLGEFNYE